MTNIFRGLTIVLCLIVYFNIPLAFADRLKIGQLKDLPHKPINVQPEKNILELIETNEPEFQRVTYRMYHKLGMGLDVSYYKPRAYDINDKVYNRHYLAGPHLRYFFNDSMSFCVSVGFWKDTNTGDFYNRGQNGEQRLKLMPVNLYFNYHFLEKCRTKPFIGIGAGIISTSLRYYDKTLNVYLKDHPTALILKTGVEYISSKNLSLALFIEYWHAEAYLKSKALSTDTININLSRLFLGLTTTIWFW